MNQAQGAQELVERARAGDQNAMAVLSLVGKNARAGSPRAQTAYALILDFIKRNPPRVPMGAETAATLGVIKNPSNPVSDVLGALCYLPAIGDSAAIQTACVLLSLGPAITKSKVKAVDQSFAGVEQNLFRFGYYGSGEQGKVRPIAKELPPSAIGFLCAGHCMGTARRIQLARLPQIPPSILDKGIGWELGC